MSLSKEVNLNNKLFINDLIYSATAVMTKKMRQKGTSFAVRRKNERNMQKNYIRTRIRSMPLPIRKKLFKKEKF